MFYKNDRHSDHAESTTEGSKSGKFGTINSKKRSLRGQQPKKLGQLHTLFNSAYGNTGSRFNGILFLLFRWKNSVYKLVWSNLLTFLLAYYSMTFVYLFLIFDYPVMRQNFELVCVYSRKFSDSLPISILTGFYITQVVVRWWGQFMALPWPDFIAMKLVCFIPGKESFHRNLRRTIMRYVNLSNIIALRVISSKLRQKYPDTQSLIQSNLISPQEAEWLRAIEEVTPLEACWAPLLWAMKLVTKARSAGKITLEPPVFANIQASFESIDQSNKTLYKYAWANFPLAYTQVATFSMVCFFVSSVLGKQFLYPNKSVTNVLFPNATITFSDTKPYDNHTPVMYFPAFAVVEVICYGGWMKVAETLLNPFGDDDEDFAVDLLIERNIRVSYAIVDDCDVDLEECEDAFLDNTEPNHNSKFHPKSAISDVKIRKIGARNAQDENHQAYQIKDLLRDASNVDANLELRKLYSKEAGPKAGFKGRISEPNMISPAVPHNFHDNEKGINLIHLDQWRRGGTKY